jgi:hypothetical protein
MTRRTNIMPTHIRMIILVLLTIAAIVILVISFWGTALACTTSWFLIGFSVMWVASLVYSIILANDEIIERGHPPSIAALVMLRNVIAAVLIGIGVATIWMPISWIIIYLISFDKIMRPWVDGP